MADRIDEIFHDKHHVSRAMLDALTPEDFILVRSVALDRNNPHRIRALDVLVTGGFAQAPRVLEEILRDANEDVGARAAAAGQLGHLGRIEAEPLLVEALARTSEPSVQVEIAASLAKVGGPDALQALGRLIEVSGDATRQQADFARSVIAYRHRIQGFNLPVPAANDILSLDREQAVPFTIVPASFRETAMAFAFLSHETYGMRFTRDFVFSIKCGPEQLLLAFDQHWLEGGIDETIGTRPVLLGLVGRWAQVNGSYSTAWLVLSWPDDAGRINLAVHRPSGPQVMFGQVAIASNGLEFGVRSVRTLGAVPVELEGRFAGSNLEIRTALSGQSRTIRRTPAPMGPTRGEPSL